MKPVTPSRNPPRLAVVPATTATESKLTRAQVAARLGVSISSVRRYEGSRLHPVVDDDEVRWFDVNEVSAVMDNSSNDQKDHLLSSPWRLATSK